MTGAALEVHNLTKVYGMGEATVHALRGLSLTVERGDFVAIMEVGARAKRLIRLVDGQIVGDVRQSPIDRPPVGAHVDPIDKQVTVVGVLEEKSSSGGFQDSNDTAIAPITAVRQVLSGYGALSSILVEATSPDKVDAVQSEVSTILDQKLNVTSSSGGGSGQDSSNSPYRIQNASQLLETQTETADTFTTLLGAVAAISLLVGGIGITNIMLVTVTERTREIGIRKALGAPRRTILTQFLIEATLLSVIGGVLGVVAALIGSTFQIVGVKPVIVPSSIGLALGVSIAIGAVLRRPARQPRPQLRPIDALRYE